MVTPTTQVIPPVQLPPGVVPTPQAGTSKDTLALAKNKLLILYYLQVRILNLLHNKLEWGKHWQLPE